MNYLSTLVILVIVFMVFITYRNFKFYVRYKNLFEITVECQRKIRNEKMESVEEAEKSDSFHS
jgi:hypothetical protein